MPPSTRIYLACGTTDMRKGINGLAVLAQDQSVARIAGGQVGSGVSAEINGDEIVVTGDPITSRLLPLTTDYQFAWYQQQMGDSTLGARAHHFAQKALSQYPKLQVRPPSHNDSLAAAILASGGGTVGTYRPSGSSRISAPGWLDTVSSYSPLPFNRMYEDTVNLPRDIRRNGLDWFLRDQPVTLGGGAVSVTTGAATATSTVVGGIRSLLPKTVERGVGSVWHATATPGAARSILGNGIDPAFMDASSRFGKGFYVAEQPGTSLAELAYHGVAPTNGIRFSVNQDALRLLDLTDASVARAWGYKGGPISSQTQALGTNAAKQGYNGIRFTSERAAGSNLVVIRDFNDVLRPVMVTPTRP